MILRRLPVFALISVTMAAAPPTAPSQPAPPTPAQRAEIQALTEKLGACHRSQATVLAKSAATPDQIVAKTIAACQSRVTPIRAKLTPFVGAERADAMLAANRPHWRDAIKRIVAAVRATR